MRSAITADERWRTRGADKLLAGAAVGVCF
jgi:hypothetical protein